MIQSTNVNTNASMNVNRKNLFARRVRGLIAGVAVVSVLGAAFSCAAGDPAAAVLPTLDAETWTIRVQPRAWFVAPSGDIELPSAALAGQSVKLSTLDLDKAKLGPLGEVAIQSGPWMGILSAGSFDGSQARVSTTAFTLGNTAVVPGDFITSDFRWTTIQAGVGYLAFAYDLEKGASGDTGNTRLRIHAIGGVRVNDVSMSISRPGVSRSEGSRTFIEILGGAKANLQIASDFSIEIDGSIAGLHQSFSYDICAAFAYRPCDNFGVQIGYRNLHMSGRSGDGADRFKYSGALAGLFAGVEFRF